MDENVTTGCLEEWVRRFAHLVEQSAKGEPIAPLRPRRPAVSPG